MMKSILVVVMLLLNAAVPLSQTAPPDLKLPLGVATLKVDLFSPAQSIRVIGLPADTIGACTLYASLDETLEGAPYVPRHCWFGEFVGGTYTDDWDYVPTGHTYDVSVEYQTEDAKGVIVNFRIEAVRVARVAFGLPERAR